MKRLLLKSVTVLIVIALSLSALVGCANKVSGKEARATFDAFLAAVVAEDYDTAKAYLHPWIDDLDLAKEFTDLREEQGIDLRGGISENLKQVGIGASLYNSDYDGGGHQMTFHTQTVADGTPIKIICTVIRNKDGYGIYQFIVNRR